MSAFYFLQRLDYKALHNAYLHPFPISEAVVYRAVKIYCGMFGLKMTVKGPVSKIDKGHFH